MTHFPVVDRAQCILTKVRLLSWLWGHGSKSVGAEYGESSRGRQKERGTQGFQSRLAAGTACRTALDGVGEGSGIPETTINNEHQQGGTLVDGVFTGLCQ